MLTPINKYLENRLLHRSKKRPRPVCDCFTSERADNCFWKCAITQNGGELKEYPQWALNADGATWNERRYVGSKFKGSNLAFSNNQLYHRICKWYKRYRSLSRAQLASDIRKLCSLDSFLVMLAVRRFPSAIHTCFGVFDIYAAKTTKKVFIKAHILKGCAFHLKDTTMV